MEEKATKRPKIFSAVLLAWIPTMLLFCHLTVVGSAAASTSSKPKLAVTTAKIAKTTIKTTSTTTEAPTTTATIDYYAYVDYGEEEEEVEEPIDPDKTAYGVLIGVSGGACILLLYMALFGRRMRRTAIRWHVINCSWWSILHLVSYGAFAEKAPWPNYIISEDWRESYKDVECFTRSIFPFGMLFVYVEAMVLTCAPRLRDNWVFNMVFFFLLIPFLNTQVLFSFFAKWMEVTWFYSPIQFLNILTYVLFCIVTFIYFIFCLFGSCFCCFTIFSKNIHKRSVFTFVDMWLLFPYGLIPAIMYGPSFGFTFMQFFIKFFFKWLEDDEDPDDGGAGGGFSEEFMAMVQKIVEMAILAMPWFVLLIPLVQVILAVFCIKMFREQFFFLFSCGRAYDGPALPKPKDSMQWASPVESLGDYPPVETMKMEEA